MTVKQISVFIENRSGRLREVTDVLGKSNINIRALSLADTSDYGILRLIVDKPDETLKVLKDANFTLSETDVLAVEVPDRPGGLATVLEILDSRGINVEYMYAFVEKSSNNAIMVFRIENLEGAAKAFADNNIMILDNQRVTNL